MVKWPSLLDAEYINQDEDEVRNTRYYKKHLKTIIPIDVMKDIESDKQMLLQQLQRENSKLQEAERKWGVIDHLFTAIPNSHILNILLSSSLKFVKMIKRSILSLLGCNLLLGKPVLQRLVGSLLEQEQFLHVLLYTNQ